MKHLLPYLPYGLKAMVGNIEKDVLMHQNYSNNYQIWFMILLGDAQVVAKPILKPLHDLTYGDIESLKDKYDVGVTDDGGEMFRDKDCSIKPNEWRYDDVEYLIKNHFDVFGLIEKGLAVEEKIKEKAKQEQA